MKRLISAEDEQKEILAIAKGMYGEERIKAYQLANRPDLVKEYADELLICEGVNFGEGPRAFSPYSPECWQVLIQKQEFDKKGISYDSGAVKKGLANTHMDIYEDRPSKDGVKTIDAILEAHGLNEEEGMDFFVKLRKQGEERTHPSYADDEVLGFCLGRLKETGYSNLAERTGVPRKEVVASYLDSFFKRGVDHLRFIDDLSLKLWTFMQRENVGGEKIVSRAVKAIQDYMPTEFANSRDVASHLYYFVNGLSTIPSVKFSRDIILMVLNRYVKSGGELREGYGLHPDHAMFAFKDLQNDPNVRALREESIRNEIERGPICIGERVEYAIKEFNLNPHKGWLKKALKQHMSKWLKDSREFDLSSAIYFGREYGLLSEEEIESLGRKLDLIKMIKGK